MIIDHVHAPGEQPGSMTTSLASQAYQHIKDRLIMLDIRPGEPINDVGLAAELGVGRTPVREALKRLETDHLVVSYPRRGTFATVVDVTELGSISDIRQLLEPHAARRAAENATPSAARGAARGRRPDCADCRWSTATGPRSSARTWRSTG